MLQDLFLYPLITYFHSTWVHTSLVKNPWFKSFCTELSLSFLLNW